MASVTLENVGKTYGALNVMRGIDVRVKQGEFVALVGPSGCGKSTLLRMIAGLEDISAGTVRIGERIVNDLQPRERDIAMVFQNYALYPHMNVAQNMGFSLRLAKQSKAEIERQVLEAARILDIEPLLKRLPKQLSGGQRQRVAMGRAIVRNPQVFLFDEPLSNLDAKLRVQMRSEIKRLHNRVGATTIYVTHDQIEAMTMADRIVVLRAGNVEQIGAPIELYDDPANLFVASFIGSPPVNLLPGHFDRSSGADAFVVDGDGLLDVQAGRTIADHEPVIMAIRPDKIRLGAPSPGECGASGIVSNVEPTGAETIVFINIGSCTVSLIERERGRQPKIDETVQISFDPSAAQFFGNGEAGERIRLPDHNAG